MALPFDSAERAERRMLIAFADLTRYTAVAVRTDDTDVAHAANHVHPRRRPPPPPHRPRRMTTVLARDGG